MNKHYHLVGIGGIGMSALAEWLLKEGCTVTGSDVSSTALTCRLEALGAKISKGHTADPLVKDTQVVFSTGIPLGNVELERAETLGCRTFHRSDLIRELVGTSPLLVVTGAHGKTSTSGLLAEVLDGAGLSPSFLIGGISGRFGVNGRRSDGEWVVLEGDESDGSFLNCTPRGAIVTNIDREHLKYWKSEEALLDGFIRFEEKVEDASLLFFCGDDKKLSQHYKRGTSYGYLPHNELRITHVRQKGWYLFFDLSFEGRHYRDIQLKHIGEHQALNATAVFGLALRLGIKEEAIREAFKQFGGVKRRLEVREEKHEVLYLDDYGHHPTEIKTTLEGLKKAFPSRRLVVAFQPHRFSRTEENLALFGTAFSAADLLLLTDIYSAGEAANPHIHSALIQQEIAKHSTVKVELVSRQQVAKRLEDVIRPFDVCLSMGAGDITHLFNEMSFPAKTLKVGVLFGGASVEHEISLRSAAHVIEGCSAYPLEPVFFGIDREGGWHSGQEAKALLAGKSVRTTEFSHVLKELYSLDVVFPVLHGTNGEDGRLQGMLEMLGIPYVGCNSESCQLAMDKDLTKLLAEREGIATAPYAVFTEHARGEIPPFPLWVKPVHLGSSVGIKRVADVNELEEAVTEAFKYDDKLIIEKDIVGRELEFLVIGNEEITVFPPGEILSNGAFYSYETKYGSNGFETACRADLSAEIIEEGKRLAARAYRAIGGKGFARVDFFLDEKGKFWLNEINPLPGFTSISLVPKIALENGYPIEALTRWLLLLGLQESRRRARLKLCP